MKLYYGTVVHETSGNVPMEISMEIYANSLEDATVSLLTSLRELTPHGNFTEFNISLIGGENND